MIWKLREELMDSIIIYLIRMSVIVFMFSIFYKCIELSISRTRKMSRFKWNIIYTKHLSETRSLIIEDQDYVRNIRAYYI